MHGPATPRACVCTRGLPNDLARLPRPDPTRPNPTLRPKQAFIEEAREALVKMQVLEDDSDPLEAVPELPGLMQVECVCVGGG